MEFKFNVTGQERKSLVGAISEILNQPTHYNGAPTFSYKVGDYEIDKNGTVTGEWDLRLMVGLENRGFEYEPSKTFHLITPRGTLLIQKHFLTAEDAQAEGYDMYFSHQGRGIFTKPSGASEHGKYFAVVGEPFRQEEPKEKVPEEIQPEAPAEDPTSETDPDNFDGEEYLLRSTSKTKLSQWQTTVNANRSLSESESGLNSVILRITRKYQILRRMVLADLLMRIKG
jgi:hypothetical protein